MILSQLFHPDTLVKDLGLWLVTAAIQFWATIVVVRSVFRTENRKAAFIGFLWFLVYGTYGAIFVFGTKQYVAEAFIIPTGGMADFVWGYHKTVSCPKCGYTFAINASAEAEAPPGMARPITRCQCPNCRYYIDFAQDKMNPRLDGGDRLLVAKLGYGELHRHQAVIFRFPVDQRMSYVKRLIGLPGETIAISGGKLCVYTEGRQIPSPESFWAESLMAEYPWPEDREAQDLFKSGKFKIIRKPADLVLGLRHLVFDNDHQPPAKENPPARWNSEAGWKANDSAAKSFSLTESTEALTWFRYRHLLSNDGKPELITDFTAYNTNEGFASNGDHWVGDLILECAVTVEKPEGELRLELSKGVDHFQARFNLATGRCSAARIGRDGEKQLGWSDTAMSAPGTYRLRFANVDECVRLWINDLLIGGDEGMWGYDAPAQLGPTENDLQPAAIGVKGTTLSVANLKLWRDNYYTGGMRGADGTVPADDRSDPTRWGALRESHVQTFYVHPGHYFVLGDNSTASADSRSWGLVPEQNMLGPAMAVYFPLSRARWLR